MAKPRIFVSSTYYDLKNVRAALRDFIVSMGYDAILNETGSIPYGKQESLDTYCYDEVRTCDIVLAIIGGRFGSTASGSGNSISQKELKTALELGKQVYIFIERDVLAEFSTYRSNKDAVVKWAYVDNVAIYKFIEELYQLPFNNAIFSFDSTHSIISLLRDQWAGLFQRLLQDKAIGEQRSIAQELSQGLSTLRSVIAEISRGTDREASAERLTSLEHPAYARLKNLLKVRYRVFFLTKTEMEDWLNARNYRRVDQSLWDNPTVQEWFHKQYSDASDPHPMLKIDCKIFDEAGQILPADEIPWTDDLIKILQYDPEKDKIYDPEAVTTESTDEL